MEACSSIGSTGDWFVRESVSDYCANEKEPGLSIATDKRTEREIADWSLSFNDAPLGTDMSVVQNRLADIAAIASAFPPDDPEAVVGFMFERPDLPKLIAETASRVWQIFGLEASLHLSFLHDPDEGFDELFLVISTGHEIEKAFNLLNQFDSWFIDLPFDVRKDFCVTLR